MIQATGGHRRMYLFDMLPSIFPNFTSPNTVLNGCKEDLFQRLRAQVGYASDMKLLSAFVNIAGISTPPINTSSFLHTTHAVNTLYEYTPHQYSL